jgi:hypothetical protein
MTVAEIGMTFAPFVWLVSAVHALWNLRNELMLRQAQMIAQQIALTQQPSRRLPQ